MDDYRGAAKYDVDLFNMIKQSMNLH
jgi:hypothetical protein